VFDFEFGHRSVIAFRFIPNSVVTRPISAVWIPAVEEPWYKLPRPLRLTIGWLCLLAIVFGSAFGFKPEGVSYYFHP
jgi:CNT family concentrative nucleoside transporter